MLKCARMDGHHRYASSRPEVIFSVLKRSLALLSGKIWDWGSPLLSQIYHFNLQHAFLSVLGGGGPLVPPRSAGLVRFAITRSIYGHPPDVTRRGPARRDARRASSLNPGGSVH